MKTWVEFSTRNPKSRRRSSAGTVFQRVQSRDISALDLLPDAVSFYFFDTPDHIADDGDPGSEQENPSQHYFIAEKRLTRAEAMALDPKEKRLKGVSDTPLPGRKISERAALEAAWDVRYAKGTFVLSYAGSVERIYPDRIVITRDKKQIYPKPKPPLTAELTRKVPTLTKLTLKKRPGL